MMDQAPATTVNTRARSRRPAAVVAVERTLADMNDVGQNSGDVDHHLMYAASDDNGVNSRTCKKSIRDKGPKAKAASSDEDQLMNNDDIIPNARSGKKTGKGSAESPFNMVDGDDDSDTPFGDDFLAVLDDDDDLVPSGSKRKASRSDFARTSHLKKGRKDHSVEPSKGPS